MAHGPTSNLERGLDILFALASDDARGGVGVGVMAGRLERDRGQVTRGLRALERASLVDRDGETLRYRLGWALYTIGSRAADARLRARAPAELARLVSAVGESSYVTVLRGSQSVTIAEQTAPRAVQIASWVGRPFPAYCSDAGRALLFDASAEEVDAVFHDVDLRRHTSKTARSVADFYGRLAASRPLGYTVMDEEVEPGVMAVAAPIRDFRGEVVAAVNVTGGRASLAPRIHAVAQQVLASAAALSSVLGFGASPDRVTAEPEGQERI